MYNVPNQDRAVLLYIINPKKLDGIEALLSKNATYARVEEKTRQQLSIEEEAEEPLPSPKQLPAPTQPTNYVRERPEDPTHFRPVFLKIITQVSKFIP